ncbi:MuF-C-terminal domain-containing protein [Pasteurella multocida]|uniref:MuF-C-terminal domain-containing protein n=1 Tax=Pasteurella multocida TaxID=747 RepID=UPI002BB04E57|nr:LPD38 domain-containing protein [Pasteurella multocida]MEB3492824.1 LPD38 domain-containing protein [Pasteurella multocida]
MSAFKLSNDEYQYMQKTVFGDKDTQIPDSSSILMNSEPKAEEQGFMGDVVDSFQMGAWRGASHLARGLGTIFDSEWLNKAADLAATGADENMATMSSKMREALGQSAFDGFNEETGEGQGVLNAHWWAGNLGALLGEQLDTVLTLGAGKAATTGIKFAAKKLSKEAAEQIGEVAVKEAAKRGVPEHLQRAMGVTAVMSAMSAGNRASQVYDEVGQMSNEDLANLEGFKQTYWGLKESPKGQNLTHEELFEQAKQSFRNQVGRSAALDPAAIATDIVSNSISGLGGGLWGLAKPGQTIKSGLLKGALLESTTEGVQGVAEQYAINKTAQNYYDPNRELTDGMEQNIADGMVLGSVFGGVMGGIDVITHKSTMNKERKRILDAIETGNPEIDARIKLQVESINNFANDLDDLISNQRINALNAMGRKEARAIEVHSQMQKQQEDNQADNINDDLNALSEESGDLKLSRSQREIPSFYETENRLSGQEAYQQAVKDGKTELSYRQWVQVRTPEFKAWFGDWESNPENASKVINPRTGEPLVAYHGTKAEFNTFDINKVANTIHGMGHYFSDDRDVSKGYGDRVINAFLKSDRTLSQDGITLTKQEISKIIDNDEILENFGDISRGREKVLENALNELLNLSSDKEIVDYISDISGNELTINAFSKVMNASFKHYSPSGAVFHIPLNANSIKSATDNTGEFNVSNDDIRYSLNEDPNSDFARAVDTVSKGGKPSRQYVPMGATPAVLKMLGIKDTKVLISRDVLNKVMGNKHHVTPETLKQLPSQLNNPVAVMKSAPQATQQGYVVLTELVEKNPVTGQQEPIISALHLKTAKDGIEVINIASIYGKKLRGLQNMLNHDLLYWNKEKGSRFIDAFGLQLPSKIASNNVSQSNMNIKAEADLSQYIQNKKQPQSQNLTSIHNKISKFVGKHLSKHFEVVTAAEMGISDSTVEAGYNPKTGKIFIVADNIRASNVLTRDERLAWVAWHELAHRGLGVKFGAEFNDLMAKIDKNSTINKLANAIQKQRSETAQNRHLAVEEALAELHAAYVTGKLDELKSRYNIEIPKGHEKGLKSWFEMTAQRIREFIAKLFGKETADKFSNEDLINLLTEINRNAGGEVKTYGQVKQSEARVNEALNVKANTIIDGDSIKNFERAKEQGYNTDYYYRHATQEKEPIEKIGNKGNFGGIFTIQNDMGTRHPNSVPYGTHYEDFIIKGEPMTHDEFSRALYDSEESYEKAKDVVSREAVIKKDNLTGDEWEAVFEYITEDRSIMDDYGYNNEPPEFIQDVFGIEEEQFINAQRFRILLAKEFGATAVEMNDENGTSVALLPSSGVRSIYADFDPNKADQPYLRFSKSATLNGNTSVLELSRGGNIEPEPKWWDVFTSRQKFKEAFDKSTAKLDEWLADSLRPVNDWIDEMKFSDDTGKTSSRDHEKRRLKDAMYTAKGKRDALNSELEANFLKPILSKIAQIAKKSNGKINEETAKEKAAYWVSARYSIEKNIELLKTDKQAMLEAEKVLDNAKANGSTDEVREAQKAFDKAERQYLARKSDVWNKDFKNKNFKVGTAGGWSIPEAQESMRGFERDISIRDLEELRELIADLNQARLEIDYRSGRYTTEEYNKFKANRYYVPLTGDPNAEVDDFDFIGGAGANALNIAKEKSLDGRKFSEAEDAIDAVWKAVGKTTTYAGWSDFKNKIDDLFETEVSLLKDKGYTEKDAREQASKNIGISKRRMQGLTRSSDNVLIAKQGGLYYEYELPERAMNALKNDNMEYANAFLKALSKPTSWYARGVTQWTLTFAPINMFRDTWEKSEFIRVQKVYDKNGKQFDSKTMDRIGRGVWNNALNPSQEVWQATKRFGFGQELRDSVESERLLKELLKNGGISNYGTYLDRTETDLVKKLKRENNPIANKLDKVAGVLESYNKMFDTVSALAAYKSLIDNGVDSKQAAAITLNLTNFRKTGSKMKGIKALYLFSQPTVMGAANLVRYLSTRKGQLRFLTYTAGAIALYTVLRSMDDEDEGGNKMDQLGDITRFIPIPIGNGDYFKFPVGFGMPQMAWNFATNIVKGTVSDISYIEAGVNMLSHSMKTFAPVSPSEISAAKYPLEKLTLTATPSILQPLMQNVLNRSAFGNKITTNFVRDDKLKAEQSKSTTAQFWKDLAVDMQQSIGIDMHPEQIKNLFDGYSAMLGSLRELNSIFIDNPNREQLGRNTRTPFLNQLYGAGNEFAVQSRYYEASEEAQSVFKEYAYRKENKQLNGWLTPERQKLIKFHEKNAKVMGELRREKAKLTRQLREGKISSTAYESRIKKYNQSMDKLQRRILTQYRRMEGLNTL